VLQDERYFVGLTALIAAPSLLLIGAWLKSPHSTHLAIFTWAAEVPVSGPVLARLSQKRFAQRTRLEKLGLRISRWLIRRRSFQADSMLL